MSENKLLVIVIGCRKYIDRMVIFDAHAILSAATRLIVHSTYMCQLSHLCGVLLP